ncbi:MAG TPA: selenium-dependent molybdenum cofactor biosynthesis protein YqeB [Vicinamibacteria bacterium]|nr:selenium-dependent molybdenum cofactor biosynthesis protein YqeB [Vicinamibacteria bacterium]
MDGRPRVVVRGGGELATGGARLLFLSGFPVAVLERPAPLAVRRLVSFAQAVFAGEAEVEGVRGRLVDAQGLEPALAARAFVPVLVDPEGASLVASRVAVIVDARMAKRNLGSTREQAPLVVGLGPGFTAGLDVHAVVETQRGPALGRVYWRGKAEKDTMEPAAVRGETERRVLRAPCAGTFAGRRRIGDVVGPGAVIGEVGGDPVCAQVPGMVRGLLADGVRVGPGEKVGDIEPRGADVDPARVSDKARAVAAGVLEAVLIGCGSSGST